MSDVTKGNKKTKTKAAEVTSSYNAESIRVITDDILRLRERFESYIGYSGTMAALHLLKEVLQNSIDEAGEAESPCDEIFLDYNQKENIIRIKDNGRGIPITRIVELATILQSSGKFRKVGKKNNASSYKFSAGINGVGLTAANGLSHWCRIVVCRDGIKWECVFKEGVVQSSKKIGKSNETSTDVTFQPSEEVLGKINLEPAPVLELAETMAHISRVKIKVHITPKGKDGDINKIFKSNGIVDALINLAGRKNMMIEPIYFKKEVDDKRVEVAITYVNNSTDEKILSYANYCTTVDHGTHVTGVKTGLTRALTKYVKDNILNAKEKEKLNITGDDCRSGLVCVVNADHLIPSFIGQVKLCLEILLIDGNILRAYSTNL